MTDKPCDYHLTFDIDWAPDHSVAQILEILEKNKVKKCTFFVTHESDIIQDIERRGHNIGIHPNFMPGSSQGSDIENIIENLLNIAPNATTMRTHALIQSSPMLFRIFKNFPQIKIDFSILTYKAKYIEKSPWVYDSVLAHRINFNWIDDFASHDETFDWKSNNLFGEKNILDFHPIHISLNSNKGTKNYFELKEYLGKKSLINASKDEIAKFINYDAPGVKDYFLMILGSDNTHLDYRDIV